MARRLLVLDIVVALFLFAPVEVDSQAVAPYSMKVSVNEVELTLHAEDARGTPINDLHPDELKILDNEDPRNRIVAFKAMRDLPIRAAILVDTSSSMAGDVNSIQSIATTYAQRILNGKTDQAFVMSFNKRLQMRQTWSNDPVALARAIQQTGTYPSTTALYDAIYSVCHYQFGALPHNASGNFIMLFSDGDDDASFLSLQQAIDMCQQTNTAIYAFRTDSAYAGLHNLSQIAALTGGRIFRIGAQGAEIKEDLDIIQGNLRNQYRVTYSPFVLKRDGSFHRIAILTSDRVASVRTRSGYYALPR